MVNEMRQLISEITALLPGCFTSAKNFIERNPFQQEEKQQPESGVEMVRDERSLWFGSSRDD
jgi:hypothetical protein